MVATSAGSQPHRSANLLDRLTAPSTLELHNEQLRLRERQVIQRHMPLRCGEVLSVGCGWNPGREMFPAPSFRLVAVDADPARVAVVASCGRADEAHVGYAGRLEFPDASFDVALYRLVLHHLAYQGSLEPVFEEAARLLRPGGSLVAIEPGLWHPVGAALALANALKLSTVIHGTPDDVPLSPRRLHEHARLAGLSPQLHALTYSWRRLPPPAQRLLQRLDGLGSRPLAAPLGHTLMLIATKRPGGSLRVGSLPREREHRGDGSSPHGAEAASA